MNHLNKNIADERIYRMFLIDNIRVCEVSVGELGRLRGSIIIMKLAPVFS